MKSRSETETVINELFGEELEKMDRERLADNYDVLDLKELESYDPGSWIIQSTTSMRRRRSKSPPQDSLNSLWDNYNDLDNDNAEDKYSILSKTLHTPSSTTRAKHL